MKKLTLAVGVLSATAFTTQAASIGLNFGAGRPNASLGGNASAGVVPQTNWNNLGGGTGGPTVLNGDSGAPTSASVTWTADEQWSIADSVGAPADANGTLLKGWISENDTGGSPIDITGIPYSTYDLYFYINHDRSAEDVTLNEVNGAFSDFILTENNTDITVAVSFVEQTTSGVGSGNYVRFSGLTASTLNINLLAVDNGGAGGGTLERNPITGIQIVEVVPEPSSSLMALLAAVGFVVRRRR